MATATAIEIKRAADQERAANALESVQGAIVHFATQVDIERIELKIDQILAYMQAESNSVVETQTRRVGRKPAN